MYDKPVGYPLLLAAFGWLFWRLGGSWFGGANKRLNRGVRVHQ
jgi:hypothetical protein